MRRVVITGHETGEGEEMHDATNVVEKVQSVDDLFAAFREQGIAPGLHKRNLKIQRNIPMASANVPGLLAYDQVQLRELLGRYGPSTSFSSMAPPKDLASWPGKCSPISW